MKLSNYEFFCPFCSVRLDFDNVIDLNTERENGEKGKISLSTTFGNYGFNHNPIISFNHDEILSFYCPKCNEKVHSSTKSDFASITMKVEKKYKFELLFSRRYGIHETYVVTEDGIERFGRDFDGKDFKLQ